MTTYRKSIVGLLWLLLRGVLLTGLLVAVAYLVRGTMPEIAVLLVVVSVVAFLGTLALAYAYTGTYVTVDKTHVTVYTQVSIFGNEVSTCELREVEDVLVNTSGIFRIAFDYGTLTIQTAGSKPNFTVTDLAHPGRAKAQIIGLSTGI